MSYLSYLKGAIAQQPGSPSLDMSILSIGHILTLKGRISNMMYIIVIVIKLVLFLEVCL